MTPSIMKTRQAMDILVEALKAEGKAPGSYYHTWQSNIAMCMYDAEARWIQDHHGGVIPHEQLEVYNLGAKNFLDMLISVTEYSQKNNS